MIQENVCQRKPVFWDILCSETLVGSSQRKCSIKESFLKNFTKFTGKHLLQSLFYIKLQTWALQLSYKKDWYRCFPSNFAKFFIFWKTSFLQNTSGRLLLIIAVGLELHRNKFKFIMFLLNSFKIVLFIYQINYFVKLNLRRVCVLCKFREASDLTHLNCVGF